MSLFRAAPPVEKHQLRLIAHSQPSFLFSEWLKIPKRAESFAPRSEAVGLLSHRQRVTRCHHMILPLSFYINVFSSVWVRPIALTPRCECQHPAASRSRRQLCQAAGGGPRSRNSTLTLARSRWSLSVCCVGARSGGAASRSSQKTGREDVDGVETTSAPLSEFQNVSSSDGDATRKDLTLKSGVWSSTKWSRRGQTQISSAEIPKGEREVLGEKRTRG